MVFIDCWEEGENMGMPRFIWLHNFSFFFFPQTELDSLMNLHINGIKTITC